MDQGTEAAAGEQKPMTMLSLSRSSGHGLHVPGQTTSVGSGSFSDPSVLLGVTSTKHSSNLLQWLKESSINQQLVKVKAWSGEETQTETAAWQW